MNPLTYLLIGAWIIYILMNKKQQEMSNKQQMQIPNRIKTRYGGVEEIMAAMLNKTEQFENDEIEDLEGEFYEEFEVGFDQFHKIIEHLMPYSFISKSPLSDTIVIGFADHNRGMYLVKEELNTNKK